MVFDEPLIVEYRSRGAFGLQYNIVEHLVNFGEVLIESVEHLACQLQGIGLFVEAASHQHFESGELQLGQLELVHVSDYDGPASLHVLPHVCWLINDPLNVDLKLLAAQFCLDFLKGAWRVAVVDIDKVRLDVVRDGLVMFGFPESGLSRSASQPVSANKIQSPHINVQQQSIIILHLCTIFSIDCSSFSSVLPSNYKQNRVLDCCLYKQLSCTGAAVRMVRFKNRYILVSYDDVVTSQPLNQKNLFKLIKQAADEMMGQLFLAKIAFSLQIKYMSLGKALVRVPREHCTDLQACIFMIKGIRVLKVSGTIRKIQQKIVHLLHGELRRQLSAVESELINKIDHS